MSLLDRLRRLASPAPPPAAALYGSIVAIARDPRWYLEGGVQDSIDGRFDMVALVIAQVLLRLEDGGGQGQLSADLTERFIADMDGSLRQAGFGDPSVGRRVGAMVGALGGRLGAYREARGDPAALAAALERNLWRGSPPGTAAAGWTAARVARLAARLAKLPDTAIAAGELGGME